MKIEAVKKDGLLTSYLAVNYEGQRMYVFSFLDLSKVGLLKQSYAN